MLRQQREAVAHLLEIGGVRLAREVLSEFVNLFDARPRRLKHRPRYDLEYARRGQRESCPPGCD